MEKVSNGTALTLVLGDITEHEADAIVNAANSSLLGGGGVDGAIHRVGGPKILTECKKIRQESGPLPPGRAVSTNAGELPAHRVIHTVGPIWKGGNAGEAHTLASCYRLSLSLAVQDGAETVAFPSISTGVFGYPADKAAPVAVSAVHKFLEAHPGALSRITWVLFDPKTMEHYSRALSEAACPVAS